MHNLCFSLGDPSRDGHGWYETFHITCNYNASTIEDAYRIICIKYGFDFVEEVCSEYESGSYIPSKITSKLVDLGIINKENIYHYYPGKEEIPEWLIDDCIERDGCYILNECDDDLTNYIDIFFKLIKLELPNLEWNYRDLKEQCLRVLDGAAYGLISM